jgi:hypothetical protein
MSKKDQKKPKWVDLSTWLWFKEVHRPKYTLRNLLQDKSTEFRNQDVQTKRQKGKTEMKIVMLFDM